VAPHANSDRDGPVSGIYMSHVYHQHAAVTVTMQPLL